MQKNAQSQSAMISNPSNHFDGIDYLRIFFSWCVVAWHMGMGWDSLLLNEANYHLYKIGLSEIVSFNIVVLSVSVFVTISTYLFVLRSPTLEKLKSRTWHSLKLTVFWATVYWICQGGIPFLITICKDANYSFFNIVVFILRGGNTIFYFFIILSISLAITYFANRLSTPKIYFLLLTSLIIMFFLPLFCIHYHGGVLTAYWNPLNFIAYPFGAILLNRIKISQITTRYIVLFFLISIVFSIVEFKLYISPVFFEYNHSVFPYHGRLSLFFSAFAILVLALKIKVKPNDFVKELANKSLSVYLLHLLVAPIVVGTITNSKTMAIPITIVLTYLASSILDKVLKKDLL